MKKTAVIFDLDGTLLDTLGDLAASANAALAACGFPQRAFDEIRTFVGEGVRKLVERAVPAHTPRAECDRCLAAFFKDYEAHMNVRTRPYAGIPELLDSLAKEGVKLGVLSNKYDAAVRRLCAAHFGESAFAAVRGHIEGAPKKPDPRPLFEVAAQMGVFPDEILYVGDTEVDMRTAAAARVDCVGVLWGFRPRAALVQAGGRAFAERPAEIAAWLR